MSTFPMGRGQLGDFQMKRFSIVRIGQEYVVKADEKSIIKVSSRRRAARGQVLRRRLRQRRDQPERTGIGHRGDQFGAAHPLHAALHDRMLDANEFGESRLHVCPRFPCAPGLARICF